VGFVPRDAPSSLFFKVPAAVSPSSLPGIHAATSIVLVPIMNATIIGADQDLEVVGKISCLAFACAANIELFP
jgi:hypothetical protein